MYAFAVCLFLFCPLLMSGATCITINTEGVNFYFLFLYFKVLVPSCFADVRGCSAEPVLVDVLAKILPHLVSYRIGSRGV